MSVEHLELFAAYEAHDNDAGVRRIVKLAQDRMIERDLAARGLSISDIVTRETIVDGELHDGLYRFCDRVVVPA